jgi:hypothetical protein
MPWVAGIRRETLLNVTGDPFYKLSEAESCTILQVRRHLDPPVAYMLPSVILSMHLL